MAWVLDDDAKLPELRSRRLVLRTLEFADAPHLLRLDRDARVTRLLLDHHVATLAQAAHAVAWVHGVTRTHHGLGTWSVRDLQGRFLGIVSLMPMEGGDVEIGARFLPERWGRLYAVEAGRLLCAHGLETLRLPRLVGLCHPDNGAPAAVLRRLGFRAAGTSTHFDRPALRFERVAAPAAD